MDDKTNCQVAIIGAGYMAREHIRAFADVPEVTIAGIHSRTRERAEALAGEYSIGVVCDSVAELYDKKGDLEKYEEWSKIIFSFPEYQVYYTLRFKLVEKFVAASNIPKATEYARQTLEVIDAAGKPDAAGRKAMRAMRRICNHILAAQLYEAEKYREAIGRFEKALKAEVYQEGLFQIGMCL